MFKQLLLDLLDKINASEQGHDTMRTSVEEKLDRSARNYEAELAETCRYILSKNPISVIKEINKVNKRKEKQSHDL